MSKSTIGPNPSGLCMCGCGQHTSLARQDDPRYGIVKGQPQRYIKGHQKTKSPVAHIVDENGCWVWQRAVNSSGYGHLYVSGVHKYAHVHAYEQAHGVTVNVGRDIDSEQIHHTCGNKRCVNPDHLERVSVREHREGHGIIKFDDDMVRWMRDMRAQGRSVASICASTGVSQSHTSAITLRRFRKNV